MAVDKDKPAKNDQGAATPHVIILADTSSLIQQISKTCQRLIEGVYDYRVGVLFSGVSELETYPHILITTIHSVKNLLSGTKKGISMDLGSLKF